MQSNALKEMCFVCPTFFEEWDFSIRLVYLCCLSVKETARFKNTHWNKGHVSLGPCGKANSELAANGSSTLFDVAIDSLTVCFHDLIPFSIRLPSDSLMLKTRTECSGEECWNSVLREPCVANSDLFLCVLSVCLFFWMLCSTSNIFCAFRWREKRRNLVNDEWLRDGCGVRVFVLSFFLVTTHDFKTHLKKNTITCQNQMIDSKPGGSSSNTVEHTGVVHPGGARLFWPAWVWFFHDTGVTLLIGFALLFKPRAQRLSPLCHAHVQHRPVFTLWTLFCTQV